MMNIFQSGLFGSAYNLEPETIAALALMSVKPSDGDLHLYDRLIKEIKLCSSLTLNVNNLSTVFQVLSFATHDKQSSLINWQLGGVSQFTELNTLGYTSYTGWDNGASDNAAIDTTLTTGNGGNTICHMAIVTSAGTGTLISGRSSSLQNAGTRVSLSATQASVQASSRGSTEETATKNHGGEVGMHSGEQSDSVGAEGNRSSYWKNGVWVGAAIGGSTSSGGAVSNTLIGALHTAGVITGYFTGIIGAAGVFTKTLVNKPQLYLAFQRYFASKGITI